MARFNIKRNDTLPSITATVKDSSGNAVDLTGATVKFLMYREGTEKVNDSAIIKSPPTDGIVRYDWKTGDTDTEGEYKAEFEIDFGASGKFTAPNNTYIFVKVYEDLDNA